MNKVLELENLKQEMINDKNLQLKTNLVFGEGNPDCQVLFIGEAPGAMEDELVRPFVGRSGQLLRKNIRELGWKEEEVYITNIVKRRPPENRDPLPEEIEAYRPYLARQIEIIAPKIIIPLGRFSMNFFLPEAKISRDQGKLFKVALSAGEAGGYWHVAPMFHPSAALRGNTMMKAFTDSFKKLPTMLKTIKGDTNIRMTSQSTNPKMETVKIKKITRFDKKILARVNELFLEWWAKRKYKVSSEYFKKFIKKSQLLLICDGEKIVGVLTMVKIHKLSGEGFFIEHLMIDENYRGRGLGKLLMSHAIKLAKNQRAQKIFLTCGKKNKIGHSLYKKMGFKVEEVNFYSLGL